MIAFDTDVLTEVLLGNTAYVARAAAIPLQEQAVPVIVIEEIMRGRLNIIRQAEAGRVSISLARAYELFEETFTDFRRLRILSYTAQAETLSQAGCLLQLGS
jgi:tRNA(fMet)-specific endonuclease VapC